MKSLFSVRSLMRAAAAAATLFALASPAMAKQCIWNKGAFVIRVAWFEPQNIQTYKKVDSFGINATYYVFARPPVQTDIFPIAQGRCIDRGPTQYEAVIFVQGGMYPNHVSSFGGDWKPEDTPSSFEVIGLHTTPSLTRYLDIWGTVVELGHGEGGGL